MSFLANGSELARKGAFFSRAPMLTFDRTGTLIDVNAACRELMGKDIAGCRGYGPDVLMDRLRPRLDGSLFDGATSRLHRRRPAANGILRTDELSPSVSACRYRSRRFGDVAMRAVELSCVETETGRHSGSVLNLFIDEIADGPGYEAALLKRWRHEMMWDVYAASYDQILPQLPFYAEVVERHYRRMADAGIAKILDVGAGTGNVAVRLLSDGKDVTVVDNSRSMLEKFHAKIDGLPVSKLAVIEDTAEQLPHIADGSFDGVTVLLAFFDMDDPYLALNEAVRVLKPGGTLIATDPKQQFDVDELMRAAEQALRDKGLLAQRGEAWRRIQSVAPIVDQVIQDHHHENGRSEHRADWSAETLLARLAELGFSDLSFTDSHLGNCATIAGIKPGQTAVPVPPAGTTGR